MLKILQFVAVTCLLSIVSVSSEPYCVRNESVIIRTPVMKTRQIIKRPTGAWKLFKKTKTYVETYQDFEEHIQIRLSRSCCDGYILSKFEICEPNCASGCPNNSKCVEPNRCQCQNGFISAVSREDGSHYCEPICDGGCPFNGRCIEPDVCECERGYQKVEYRCEPRCASDCPFGGICIKPNQCRCAVGYKAEQGTCLPTCKAGDGCQNGRCLDIDTCICNKGYEMNTESEICEKICNDDECEEEFTTGIELEMTTIVSETSDDEETTQDSIEFDEHEKIYLTTLSPDTDDTEFPSYGIKDCPPSFILYENACKPQVFASNEIDCRFKPCGKNAVCQANGTCTCEEGYGWFKPESSTEDIAISCLTFAEISAYAQQSREAETDVEDDIDWLNACYVALGALCMAAALCILIVKLVARRKGKMHVEVKNDLYCTYDIKDIPHVL